METTISDTFIQSLEHRPKLKVKEVNEIPLIDLSTSTPADLKRVASEIGNACENWGFFQVKNHGVPSVLRARIEETAKAFFDLSLEEKRKVKRDEVNPMGYYDSEYTKNVRDWKELFDFMLQDPTLVPASLDPDVKELRVIRNQWPDYPHDFRETCEEYAREAEKLAFRILELICLSLGLTDFNPLKDYFKRQISMLRLNHYPPCPNPELALGVGRHKDPEVLTVLAQDDVGGLQVKRKSHGDWIHVRPIPNTLIINVGDIVQVWSNDRYQSAEHRVVVNSKRERFSMAFFLSPGHNVMVKPLEHLVDEQNPAKFKEYNWGNFFVARNRSDYKKLDIDNIQIDNFRV
ncbi:protein DMR6-LIKE OXYGENASE 1-like [Carica papaya]|uniref:protein DMR6-LIKE OXYGENASE 1-like n=1 Tax=Carica papaya TaxID=3649 RepID=UPI000B8CE9B2|nr:protein DMR6-LIKE OXYGENASE 1-like [Carica papaya]